METTRNRSSVLAQLLRAAMSELRHSFRMLEQDPKSTTARDLRVNALESIDTIAH